MNIHMRLAGSLDTGLAACESALCEADIADAAHKPETGDEVLVAFEHGALRPPYTVGSLWKSSDEPPRTGTVRSRAYVETGKAF